MKKLVTYCFAVLALMPSNFFAVTFDGTTILHDQKYPELTIDGDTTLRCLIVTGNTKITGDALHIVKSQFKNKFYVNGMLNASKSNFATVEVTGNAILYECNRQTPLQKLTVWGSTVLQGCRVKNIVLHGNLRAANTQIVQDLITYANKIELRNCVVNSIFMKPPREETSQIIKLIDTQVLSTIMFEKEGGQVLLEGNSKVSGGLVGGKLIKVNKFDIVR